MIDRIEKTIELKAPVSRVWRALTAHQEFGSGSAFGLKAHSSRDRFRAVRSHIPSTSKGGHVLVVWFTNDERGLVLNKTNNRTIRGAFGDPVDGWAGKIIVVFPTMVDMRGKLTPALRVSANRLGTRHTHAPSEHALSVVISAVMQG
jgi:hypothetical protein